MSDFLARIELVNLPKGDNRDIYDKLHEQMEAQGFSRQVATTQGKRWLPDATYFMTAEVDKAEVLKKAAAAVDAAKQKGRIFIAVVSDFTARNLQDGNESKA